MFFVCFQISLIRGIVLTDEQGFIRDLGEAIGVGEFPTPLEVLSLIILEVRQTELVNAGAQRYLSGGYERSVTAVFVNHEHLVDVEA